MVVLLAGLVLLGGVVGSSTSAWAQVQIEQVEPVASEIEGPSQGQIVANLEENARTATRGVLGLASGAALPLRSGAGNSSLVVQRGTANDASVTQRGPDNATNIVQLGRDNVAGLRLNGAYNEANLAQLGVGNRYRLEYTGDNLRLNVAQIGRKNRLTQIGQGRKPFDVTMRGNGIRMVIRHGRP
jgi:hypothetical protein